MELTRKTVAVTMEKDDEQTLIVHASTGGVDRDGESISPTAWKTDRYMANPVVLFSHDYHSLPVAKTVELAVTDGGLVHKVRFPTEDEAGAHFAFTDSVRRLSQSGFLNAESVGFIGHDFQDNAKADGRKEPRRVWTDVELLEISIVPIPSNPEALMVGWERGLLRPDDIATIKGIVQAETSGGDGLKAIDWAERIEKALSRVQTGAPDTPHAPVVPPAMTIPRLEPLLEALGMVKAEMLDSVEALSKRLRAMEKRIGTRLPEFTLLSMRSEIERLLTITRHEASAAPEPRASAPGEDVEQMAIRLLQSLRQKGTR